MTNEELDRARVKEAQRLFLDGSDESPTILIAARLAREGWTPPVAVDPDLVEARKMAAENVSPYPKHATTKRGLLYLKSNYTMGYRDTTGQVKWRLDGIQRGRELERAEAKPGMVWVKHNWSERCPVDKGAWVWIKEQRVSLILQAQYVNWRTVTHYAIITQPEEK